MVYSGGGGGSGGDGGGGDGGSGDGDDVGADGVATGERVEIGGLPSRLTPDFSSSEPPP